MTDVSNAWVMRTARYSIAALVILLPLSLVGFAKPSASDRKQKSNVSMERAGFVRLPNLLTSIEVNDMRDSVLAHRTRYRWFQDYVIPDVLGVDEYAPLREHCLLAWRRAHARLPWLAGIVDMCDIQVNRTVGWHRDVLRSGTARHQIHDLWTPVGNDTYRLKRLIVYLEDHRADRQGLCVSPGTHTQRGPNRTAPAFRSGPFNGPRHVATRAGDGILFDMRLVHSGRHSTSSSPRVSLQVTTGPRDSVFTREWARGDAERRRAQMQAATHL